MNKFLMIIIILLIFLNVNINTYSSYDIIANSYVLMDIDSNRVLKGNNIHKRGLTASISKILTGIIAIENGDLNSVVKIEKKDLVEGSSIYLEIGEEILLRDLVYGLLLRSGNDAAMAIKRYISDDKFIFYMNEYAKRIGMSNSYFNNPTGLDSESKNISTPYDMALLMSYCYKNKEFMKINGTKSYSCESNKKRYIWKNKHRLINEGGIYNGGKTGYTKLARRTLITTAKKDDLNLVCVTFNDPSDWNTHKYLFDYGFNKFDKYLAYKKQIIKQDLIYYNYLLYQPFDIYLPLTSEERKKLRAEVIVNLEILNIYIADELIYSCKLKRCDVEDLNTYLDIVL